MVVNFIVMCYIQFIWNFPNTKNLLVAKIKLHGNILAPKVRPVFTAWSQPPLLMVMVKLLTCLCRLTFWAVRRARWCWVK